MAGQRSCRAAQGIESGMIYVKFLQVGSIFMNNIVAISSSVAVSGGLQGPSNRIHLKDSIFRNPPSLDISSAIVRMVNISFEDFEGL
jgi:hypothetical protein